ncbi:MAG: alpha-galactosidase [Acidobacteria bacterium]|nr:alpha-galactosidase [Acidobacteriota bacterium]
MAHGDIQHNAQTTFHLQQGGTSVIVDASGPGMPVVLYWGSELNGLDATDLVSMAQSTVPPVVSGGLDIPARLTVLPLESNGWQATPGLEGHRAGRDAYPLFELRSATQQGTTLRIQAEDKATGLSLLTELEVTGAGLFRQRHTLTNTGSAAYEVTALRMFFPLPASANEVLDATGRHLKERSPQRRPLTVGAHVRTSRRGRPGLDATLLMLAGTSGFGFRSGLVHGVHVAFSGNYELRAERASTAEKFLVAQEHLAPGEIRLQPASSYSSPWAVASWGEGLDALAARIHTELRARPTHPTTPRPVTLNSWEAVYFDHDLDRLKSIADAAAAVGVERFVLDDGWFLGRRDDKAGLGDWQVDSTVWPDGLTPLINHVKGLGLQFGLWFEPEMVNLDSDLARKHPEWILHPGDRWPVTARDQHVLNLADQGCWNYLFSAINQVLTDNAIDYIKWDHNRDLLEPIGHTGTPVVHETTLATYRLMDALKAAHPGLEIESCASGGGRVDLGVLEHTDRIWTSDCIDPLERLDNQAYTGLLVPYELMGAHIAGPSSHSTSRTHSLDFRAATAMFGHYGIEWDISTLDDAQRALVAEWVSFHKVNRHLFHTGTSVHADLPDPAQDVRGVVAQDGTRAVYVLTQRSASITAPADPVPLPGLLPERRYRVQMGTAEFVLSGQYLATAGLQAPTLRPETAVIITADAVS